jgi:antitoxin HigA-1
MKKMSLKLPTPGEILATEFLEPMNITVYRLAKAIHVPQTRIAAIIKNRRSITADTALRLARYFGTSVEFWLNLQSQFDADTARAALIEELASIEPFESAEAAPA